MDRRCDRDECSHRQRRRLDRPRSRRGPERPTVRQKMMTSLDQCGRRQRRRSKFGVITRMGDGLVFRRSAMLLSQGVVTPVDYLRVHG